MLVDIDKLHVLNPEIPTPTASSGRDEGGKHLYFRSHEAIAMKPCKWGHLNPAYLVVPGSIHPSGRQYEWLPGLSPLEVSFMPFVEALDDLGLGVES